MICIILQKLLWQRNNLYEVFSKVTIKKLYPSENMNFNITVLNIFENKMMFVFHMALNAQK